MEHFDDLINSGFARQRVVVVGDLVADQFLNGTISRVSREAPVFILKHGADRRYEARQQKYKKRQDERDGVQLPSPFALAQRAAQCGSLMGIRRDRRGDDGAHDRAVINLAKFSQRLAAKSGDRGD